MGEAFPDPPRIPIETLMAMRELSPDGSLADVTEFFHEEARPKKRSLAPPPDLTRNKDFVEVPWMVDARKLAGWQNFKGPARGRSQKAKLLEKAAGKFLKFAGKKRSAEGGAEEEKKANDGDEEGEKKSSTDGKDDKIAAETKSGDDINTGGEKQGREGSNPKKDEDAAPDDIQSPKSDVATVMPDGGSKAVSKDGDGALLAWARERQKWLDDPEYFNLGSIVNPFGIDPGLRVSKSALKIAGLQHFNDALGGGAGNATPSSNAGSTQNITSPSAGGWGGRKSRDKSPLDSKNIGFLEGLMLEAIAKKSLKDNIFAGKLVESVEKRKPSVPKIQGMSIVPPVSEVSFEKGAPLRATGRLGEFGSAIDRRGVSSAGPTTNPPGGGPPQPPSRLLDLSGYPNYAVSRAQAAARGEEGFLARLLDPIFGSTANIPPARTFGSEGYTHISGPWTLESPRAQGMFGLGGGTTPRGAGSALRRTISVPASRGPAGSLAQNTKLAGGLLATPSSLKSVPPAEWLRGGDDPRGKEFFPQLSAARKLTAAQLVSNYTGMVFPIPSLSGVSGGPRARSSNQQFAVEKNLLGADDIGAAFAASVRSKSAEQQGGESAQKRLPEFRIGTGSGIERLQQTATTLGLENPVRLELADSNFSGGGTLQIGKKTLELRAASPLRGADAAVKDRAFQELDIPFDPRSNYVVRINMLSSLCRERISL